MNIGSAFPSKYIKSSDLGQSRPVVVIESVSIIQIDQDKRPLVTFQGKSKGLVLNKTNANMITEICGTAETDQWRGKHIVLYASRTDYGGKRVDCIRVDYPPTGAPQPARTPQYASPQPAPVVQPPASEFQQDGDFVVTDEDCPF